MHEFETEVNFEIFKCEKFIDSLNLGPEHDIETMRGGKATVKWNLELEIREWGIKSIMLGAPDQIVKATITMDDEEGDEYEKQIEFELKDIRIDADFDGDRDDTLQFMQAMPIMLEIYNDNAYVKFFKE